MWPMPKPKLDRTRVHVTLAPETYARLKAWAEWEHATMSACIEEALGAVLPKTVRKERSE